MTGTDLRAEIAEARSKAREVIDAWADQGGALRQPDAWMRGFEPKFSRMLGASGLLGITWPQEMGGRGQSNLVRLAVTEELLRSGAPIAAHWIGERQIGPALLRHGSERLRKEILPLLTSGEAVFCLGLSEPEAGSDLAAVLTRARRTDDGWRLSGRKIWTSHAHQATHAYVLARTDDSDRKHDGLSEFIVDMSTAGIEVSPIRDMSGESHFNEVTFDDVDVAAWRLVGEQGRGWQQVLEQLAFERGGPERYLSSYAQIHDLLDAAREHPPLRCELGRLAAQLATLRRVAWDVASSMDAGDAPIDAAVTLKFLGNRFESSVVEAARGAFGVDGGAGSPRFQAALLASPGFSIRGGAADVLLSLLARTEAR